MTMRSAINANDLVNQTTQSKKLTCPGCHNEFKNISAHIRAGCPGPEIKPPQDTNDSGAQTMLVKALQEVTALAQAAQKDAAAAISRSDAIVQGLPELIDKMFTARMDQLLGQIQQAPGDAAATDQPPAQGRGKANIGEIIQLAQMLGINPGGNNNSSLENFVKQLGTMQTLNAMMQQPMVEGMKMMSTMLTVALRAGVSPERAAAAADELVSGLSKPPVVKSS